HAGRAGAVLNEPDRVIGAGAAEQGGDLALLAQAELEAEPAAGLEEARGLRDQALEDGNAIGAAVEGLARLVFEQAALLGFELGGRDIGRVGDDEVGSALG